jgi:hypothetical protein
MYFAALCIAGGFLRIDAKWGSSATGPVNGYWCYFFKSSMIFR